MQSGNSFIERRYQCKWNLPMVSELDRRYSIADYYGCNEFFLHHAIPECHN